MSPTNVHKTLQNYIELVKTTLPKNIQLLAKFEADDFNCLLDESQFQNAIINLIINSKDAINEQSGLITVSTQNTNLDENYCQNSPFFIETGDYLQVVIKDDGIGMNKEVQDQIFEPFFSTKGIGKGTGLGLSSVYGCIKEHQGAILLYSEEGKGTAFHLFIKTTLEKKLHQADQSILQVHQGRGTILVVDDEEAILASACGIIEEMGYTVVSAENGSQGLDIYSKDPKKFSLVVLDMIMPKLNGEETFQKIREINPDQKVIISSGFMGNIKIDQLLDTGLSGF
ncbi:ATP-binding protein, partial [bacterium]|nr:ATP-binding protein [bacterium]